MDDIKNTISLMEENVKYIEMKTRIEIAGAYINGDKYPDLKMICTILGIEYKGEK